MKKILIISFTIILILVTGLFLISGNPRTDIYLRDFEVSNDGKKITLKVGVANSAGYVRNLKVKQDENNKYITFYSTLGINTVLGAKDTFEIEIDENLNEIYFYTGNKSYKLILIRNDITQEWEKINYSANGTLKLDLLKKEDIIKVGIDTYAEDNNYFEYSDKNIIEKIYNVFNGLETDVISKTFNPENPEEMYKVNFICDDTNYIYSDKVRMDSYVDVYSKTGKYYVEQRYNGIYEIEEQDFNLIKSYIR